MRAFRVLGAILASAVLTTMASAQAVGGLKIKVIDQADKSPVIGATVQLTNTQKLIAPASVMTDADGMALFGVLRVGPGYIVKVIMDGYAPVQMGDIQIHANQVTERAIALIPEQTEKVTVVAKPEQVELEKTKTSVTFSDEFINDLPVEGRYYQNVLTLAPGVSDSNGDGNPNVNGARDRDFKATVSGISNQDPLSGKFLSQVNPDSIEEVEVVTAGASAEYGRAQGGFANIVQKQGSNDFEGVVNMLFSSSALDARPDAAVPTSLLPKYQQFQPSFSLSGPIIKDQLWYRFSHQYLNLELPANLGTSVQVSRFTQWIHSDQITWQMSPRNKLAFLFQMDPSKYTNIGVSSLVPPETTQTYEAQAPTYSLIWTAPYSPSLLVESQVAYQNFRSKIYPSTTGVKNDCVTSDSFVANAQCFNITTGTVSGSSGLNYSDNRQRLTVRTQGTYFKGRLWGMSHQFKFGITVENERFFADQTQLPDVSTLQSQLPGAPPRPGAPPSFDTYSFAFINITVPEQTKYTATGTNWGIYGEDQVKPLNNLTVTLGLRVDREIINSIGYAPFDPRSEFLAVQNGADPKNVFTFPSGIDDLRQQLFQITGVDFSIPDRYAPGTDYINKRTLQDISIANTNPAPRLSVSWDPWSDGKTRFSLTAGRFYGSTYLLIPSYENRPYTTTLVRTAKLNPKTGQYEIVDQSAKFNGLLNAIQVDRNLKTPYQDEFTFAVERELLPETSLRLTYIKRNFQDQFQLRNVNGYPADFGKCSTIQGTPVVASPGKSASTTVNNGDWILDPYTNTYYPDTDPGNGDGRLDDCQGRVAVSGTTAGIRPLNAYASIPDGIADLYLQNPLWGGVYKIGNFNTANYQGYQLELTRRQYKNWQMNASYVYSRVIGDAEDFNLLQGSDPTTIDQERGYLGYDQRHVVKVNATTILPGGVRLGGAISWQSGLPWSVLRQDFSLWAVPPIYSSSLQDVDPTVRTRYPTGQRNDQRNTSYWNFDIKAQKEFRLPGRMNLQLTASVYNLLNDQVYRIYNGGLQFGRQLNGNNEAERLAGRRFEVGFRLAF